MSNSAARPFHRFPIGWKDAVWHALRAPHQPQLLEKGLSPREALIVHRKFNGLRSGVRKFGDQGCEGLLGAVQRGELRFSKEVLRDGLMGCFVIYAAAWQDRPTVRIVFAKDMGTGVDNSPPGGDITPMPRD